MIIDILNHESTHSLDQLKKSRTLRENMENVLLVLATLATYFFLS